MGNFGIQIEFLFIWGSSEEELEKLTNPTYYKNGLMTLVYRFKRNHALSEKFFLNINQLQPQQITFERGSIVKGSYDYTVFDAIQSPLWILKNLSLWKFFT